MSKTVEELEAEMHRSQAAAQWADHVVSDIEIYGGDEFTIPALRNERREAAKEAAYEAKEAAYEARKAYYKAYDEAILKGGAS